jgi:hypothetical protein
MLLYYIVNVDFIYIIITVLCSGRRIEPGRAFKIWFFLGTYECDIEVLEVEHIDFEIVKKRLRDGKSVFMTSISEAN